MNLPLQRTCPRAHALRGFTLTEMLVTMAIFGMVVAGILSLHIFGLKLNRMVDVKLQATEDSRRALGRLVTDIHGAGIVKVGTGDASTFTEVGFNTAQRGNALQIYPFKTNTTRFVRYFLDTSDNQLMRIDSASTTPTFISGWVTNALIFTSEDFSGNVLSNNLNNRVIGIDLEFYRLDNPMIQFGHGSYYDFYRLQTRVTRRALE
jgi:prepilin-type N-terminal cleavage/methylation domain-containing protein